MPDVVVFHPSESKLDLYKFDKGLNKYKEVKELKISDIKKPTNTDDRLTKAAAFLFTGGLSVSQSVEKSIRDDRAEGRLNDNFTRPLKSLKDGWKADDNMVLINYVGHPMEWFLIGTYLKSAGATDKEAILISQLTNFTWEFIIEGNYVPPSPKDLATNTLGGLAGIYCYNTILNKFDKKTYKKLSDFGEKYNVSLIPQINYNSNTRGMVFGASIKIKK